MYVRVTKLWRGPWEAAPVAPGPLVYAASWARGEPERGAYDDAELAGWRRAAVAARRQGAQVWVVVHAGTLPDWQVAREGWLDPDVLANFGCWVDRLGRALLEAVDGWFAVYDPLAEAAWYERDARRVGRVLLDAQANTHVQLRRGAGSGAVPVGAALRAGPVANVGGLLGPARRRAERWRTEAWVRAAASGKLEPPWALTGELANGVGALDVLGTIGGDIAAAPDIPRLPFA